MPTERLASAALAALLLAGLIAGGGIALADPWDKAAHFSLFALLTLTLWHASEGRMPLFILSSLVALGALDEWRQAYIPGRVADPRDFLADLAGVLATGTLLLMQRKPVCAESSPR